MPAASSTPSSASPTSRRQGSKVDRRMAYEFKLPDIGEGVVEGEIVKWLVKEGDLLGQDQPMVEIMTDKATVEIPSPRPGRVIKRMYAEGQICPVGKVLISIDETGAPGAQGVSAAPL